MIMMIRRKRIDKACWILLCARHCAKYFTEINPSYSHISPMR